MKVSLAVLATVFVLCLATTAAAQQDLRGPDQAAPAAVATQDLRGPDQAAPAAVATQDLRGPDQAAPTSASVAVPTVLAATDAVGSEGGLATLSIVLLSVGGALILSGIAYTTTRAVHARHHTVQ